MSRALITALFSLSMFAACGGKKDEGKKDDNAKKDDTKRDDTKKSVYLDKLKQNADKVCACANMGCASKAMDDFKKESEELAKANPSAKMSEEDLAAAGDGVVDELAGLLEAVEGLFEVDDVDAVFLAEQILAHLGVPALGPVAEMQAGFEQVLDADVLADVGGRHGDHDGFPLLGHVPAFFVLGRKIRFCRRRRTADELRFRFCTRKTRRGIYGSPPGNARVIWENFGGREQPRRVGPTRPTREAGESGAGPGAAGCG